MKRTYVDAGVLMRAARGTAELSAPAIDLLSDPDREFVSSALVRLEVMPRAAGQSETAFYEAFFQKVAIWVPIDPQAMAAAVEEARVTGLTPLDAIHVVLAASAECQEYVTADRPGAPIYATTRIAVVAI